MIAHTCHSLTYLTGPRQLYLSLCAIACVSPCRMAFPMTAITASKTDQDSMLLLVLCVYRDRLSNISDYQPYLSPLITVQAQADSSPATVASKSMDRGIPPFDLPLEHCPSAILRPSHCPHQYWVKAPGPVQTTASSYLHLLTETAGRCESYVCLQPLPKQGLICYQYNNPQLH